MKNKRMMKNAAIAAAMAGVLAIGGITAYFTDHEAETNTFTVGEESLDLTEPNWNPSNGQHITPAKTIAKDPKATNDGINPEYVFMTVAVPYENVVTVNADGSRKAAADTELFSYTVNSGWTEIGTVKKDAATKTVTHTYVYGTSAKCTALNKDESTPALFNNVTFANIVEKQGMENEQLDIAVDAYGIQSADVNGGKTAPADIWKVLQTQLNK